MNTAGWVITALAYVMPLSFATLAFVWIKKMYFGEHISGIGYIVYFFAMMEASQSLQVVVVVLGLYTVCILEYIFSKQRLHWFLAVQWVCSVLWLINHMLSPASKSRYISELVWLPSFEMYSIIQKAKLGLAPTTSNFIQSTNFIFVLFTFLLLICVWKKHKDPFYRMLSCIPLLFATITTVNQITPGKIYFLTIIEKAFTFGTDVTVGGGFSTPIPVASLADGKSAYFPLISQLFVFLLIAVLIYLIFGNTKRSLLMISIYFIGIATRMEMMLSPTLYASSTRTFYCMYGAMIFISLTLFAYWIDMRGKLTLIKEEDKECK
jgi:hypothetical protein